MSVPVSRSITQNVKCLRLVQQHCCRRGFATTRLAPLALRMSHPETTTTAAASFKSRYLPRFLQPSQLKTYLPSFSQSRKGNASKKKKEWNPYTFFIIAFMIIGSESINLIALKHSHRDFMRRAESRIDLLREVIEKVERGENVDVGKMLGAGNEEEEKSWEDVLKEIEEEDLLFQAKRAKRYKKKAKEEGDTTLEEEGQNKSAATAAEAVERKPRPVKKVDDSTFL